MRVDDAVKEVRRLIWLADLDHRQIIAVEVVCAAIGGHLVTTASTQVSDEVPPAE